MVAALHVVLEAFMRTSYTYLIFLIFFQIIFVGCNVFHGESLETKLNDCEDNLEGLRAKLEEVESDFEDLKTCVEDVGGKCERECL